MSSLSFTCALGCLVAAIAVGTSATGGPAPDPAAAEEASNGHACSVHNLRGLYVFDAHGWNIGGSAVPKAILQGIRFNGDGTLVSPFATVSINGVISRGGVPGTYTVNQDCTGTVTFVGGVMYDTFVRPDGGQVWMMQTSGPFGTPAVFEGTATRVP